MILESSVHVYSNMPYLFFSQKEILCCWLIKKIFWFIFKHTQTHIWIWIQIAYYYVNDIHIFSSFCPKMDQEWKEKKNHGEKKPHIHTKQMCVLYNEKKRTPFFSSDIHHNGNEFVCVCMCVPEEVGKKLSQERNISPSSSSIITEILMIKLSVCVCVL